MLAAQLRPQQAILSVRDPIRLSDFSEPQPDVAVLRWRADYYEGALPGPEDVLLLIEVADTSADVDRAVKLPLYAAGGIQEVWLVDPEAGSVDVSTGPGPEGYAHSRRCAADERLEVARIGDVSIAVRELLGG